VPRIETVVACGNDASSVAPLARQLKEISDYATK